VSRVTVSFVAITEDSTEVVIHHERIHSAAVRDDHERGWLGLSSMGCSAGSVEPGVAVDPLHRFQPLHGGACARRAQGLPAVTAALTV